LQVQMRETGLRPFGVRAAPWASLEENSEHAGQSCREHIVVEAIADIRYLPGLDACGFDYFQKELGRRLGHAPNGRRGEEVCAYAGTSQGLLRTGGLVGRNADPEALGS
jgi:hypothetical protein